MTDDNANSAPEGTPLVNDQVASAEQIAAARASGGRVARYLVGGILLFSTLLGLWLFHNYTTFQRHVRDTLEFPDEPFAWEEGVLSPEECVDEALDWATECRGVKAMCDEYVPRIVRECLGSQDRVGFCEALGDATQETSFGHPECLSRGVRRNVDAEACGSAYRTIDDYCLRLLARLAREAREAEEAAAGGASGEAGE